MESREKLAKWAELLLDVGKRNNSINDRKSKSLSAEVVYPDAEQVFDMAMSDSSFEVFKTDIDIDNDDEGYDDTADRDDYISSTTFKTKRKNQIVLYCGGKSSDIVVKSIYKKSVEIIEETGVNSLFMTFGTIHWRERSDSDIVYDAPVLQIPVIIESGSVTDPFIIKATGDETVVNESFIYKMHAEYGVVFPKFESCTFSEYIDSVSKLLKPLGWDVTKDCRIGFYSYQKLNMYRDITDNMDKILENPNIKLLLGEVVNETNCGFEDCNKVTDPLVDLFCVVDADSSQLEAIEMARSGKSFVLQGPPGTGKSQTITNIIADSLCIGKKVLFVSEKLAALNVVYDKLKHAGLSDFCLELHSHKTNKKDVIAEICRTIDVPRTTVSDRAEEQIRDKKKAEKDLNEYVRLLYKRSEEYKVNLHDVFEEISSVRNAPMINWRFEDSGSKSADYYNEAYSCIELFSDYTSSIGYDYKQNPWYGYIDQNNSFADITELRNDLCRLSEMLTFLTRVKSEISEKYGISFNDITGAVSVCKVMEAINCTKGVTPAFFTKGAANSITPLIETLDVISKRTAEYKASIDCFYEEGVYEQLNGVSANCFIASYSNILKRIFSKNYKSVIKQLKLLKKNRERVTFKDASDILLKLDEYRNGIKAFDYNKTDLLYYLDGNCDCISFSSNQLLPLSRAISKAEADRVSFERFSQLSKEEFYERILESKNYSRAISDSISECIGSVNSLSRKFDGSALDIHHSEIVSLKERTDSCLRNIDKLDNYIHFRDVLTKLRSMKLLGFVDSVIASGIEPALFADCFKKAYMCQAADMMIAGSPELSCLNRITHDASIKRFSQNDLSQFDINKARIKARLSAEKPLISMMAPGSELFVVRREGEKKRKQKSVRTLMTECHGIIQTVKPCFLMSPLSVSTYLPPDMIKFDIVIFDEASQIFPQDAIGAIYRADQLIVVGDSKQMPPTNFFNATLENDDEDEDDIADFESILDICAGSMRQLRLKWHYRSKYEQLIAFSNQNFYNNELITFPSSESDKHGIGVDYQYVDGTFDRKSHSNTKEAIRVVDLIYENIEKYPDRSLGVVAFSVAQQDLIDKMLFKKRHDDPRYEEFFKADREEPFFVKNLETVQGDERDTIIFSVAYAPDTMGKLYHNFGPLNRAGGERRLNVAVTRAKYNVILVSSMHYSDIDLKKTSAKGASLLRDYLNYAEFGESALNKTLIVDQEDKYDSDFEKEVHEFLIERGFAADTQIGCSGYRIDIGVKLPQSSDYVLAVECDGATYHSLRNARDRDRLRQQVLESMGWRFYRIWSTDWYKNKTLEKTALLKAAAEAVSKGKARNPVKNDVVKEEDTRFEVESNDDGTEFPKYKCADISTILKNKNGKRYIDLVKEIMETEAPISEEYLQKRTVSYFGREKVTSFTLTQYENEMKNAIVHGIIRRNGFLYLKDNEINTLRVPGTVVRDIKYICIEELAAGMIEIIRQNGSVERSGLYHTLAMKCGFQRAGAQIWSHFDEVVMFISPKLNINGETITLK